MEEYEEYKKEQVPEVSTTLSNRGLSSLEELKSWVCDVENSFRDVERHCDDVKIKVYGSFSSGGLYATITGKLRRC